jgi:hypothetical protein
MGIELLPGGAGLLLLLLEEELPRPQPIEKAKAISKIAEEYPRLRGLFDILQIYSLRN